MVNRSSQISVEAQEILELISRGYSYDQILHALPEANYRSIFDAADEALSLITLGQVPSSPMKYRRAGEAWSAHEEDEVLELYSSGVSASQVAKIQGRSPGAIRSRVRRLRNEAVGGERSLGIHPSTHEEVWLIPGHFGPYLKHGEETISVPLQIDPANIVLKDAIGMLAGEG